MNINILQEWFKAGVFFVGVGSSLTKDTIKKDDYTIIKDRTQKFINKYKEIKDQIENNQDLFKEISYGFVFKNEQNGGFRE